MDSSTDQLSPTWTTEISKGKKALEILKKIGKKLVDQWFLLGMVLAITLAYFFPEYGKKYGPLHPEITVTYLAIILVFLSTGLALKLHALKHSFMSWKHQLLSFVMTYGAVSLVTFGITKLLGLAGYFDRYLLEGLVVMSCLPMTIASCTIFTQAAGGNEELSVINSIISNCLGVFVSPGLILLYLGLSSSLDIGKVFLQLTITVVIPLIVGVVLQLVAKKPVAWVVKRVKFGIINQVLLVFVIYCTFCDTFTRNFTLPKPQLAAVVGVVVGLHFLYVAMTWGAYWLPFWHFSWEDKVAGFFGASQKTLGVGIPLISIIYGGSSDPNAGLASIPILILHPFQLVVAGFLASQLQKRKPKYQALDHDADHMEMLGSPSLHADGQV